MDILSLLLPVDDLSPLESLLISIVFIVSALYWFVTIYTKVRNVYAGGTGDIQSTDDSKIEISPSAMRKKELIEYLKRDNITDKERAEAEKRLASFDVKVWQMNLAGCV